MKESEFLTPAPPNYVWPQCPEADQFIASCVDKFLRGHSFAQNLATRLKVESSTEFQMCLDHLVLPKRDFSEENLRELGFVPDRTAFVPSGTKLWWHPFADLPKLLLSSKSKTISCGILADSISHFLLMHGISAPILGTPLSRYREARVPGEKSDLFVIERRGTRTHVPDQKDYASRLLPYLEKWVNRPRHFSSLQHGLKSTQALARELVKNFGTGLSAWIFLEGERRYWQSRNTAGQIQKMRQDKVGLGWANHDHHTFRSSRPAFIGLMEILKIFGFKKRERYYAGLEAGWGAQILEQPEAKLIIFADVDLTPDEVSVDFTTQPLKELKRPGTIGLWCALHGESILEAGMHHLEAKFDFDHLKMALQNQIAFMKPFSDFPHLRQAFSEGELWPVPKNKLDKLLALNWISQEAYNQIREKGAVGSHLENLQRRNGFKGFNQKGVSEIIKAVNPEIQALKKSEVPPHE